MTEEEKCQEIKRRLKEMARVNPKQPGRFRSPLTDEDFEKASIRISRNMYPDEYRYIDENGFYDFAAAERDAAAHEASLDEFTRYKWEQERNISPEKLLKKMKQNQLRATLELQELGVKPELRAND